MTTRDLQQRLDVQKPCRQPRLSMSTSKPHNPALERHYSIIEIALIWGLSQQTITKFFMDEPGVLKHGNPPSRKRRTYTTLRVPESVMIRVHTRLKQ
jgi:hypothetical protein